MEYYKVAAKWWADKLRKLGPGNFNNGDESISGGVTMALDTMLAMNSKPSDDAIDLFEEKLAKAIKEYLEKQDYIILSVDYGPDYILASIAEKSGLSTRCFPWKTTMWVRKDKVSVRAGYGAPIKVIFSE